MTKFSVYTTGHNISTQQNAAIPSGACLPISYRSVQLIVVMLDRVDVDAAERVVCGPEDRVVFGALQAVRHACVSDLSAYRDWLLLNSIAVSADCSRAE